MRMLLTSDGVLAGVTKEALLELVGKPISECRTVVIIDAILPFPGDKSGLLEHLEAYRALGWAECDILTLLSGPPSGIEARLRAADVIFSYGGTNHWLAHAWRASGLAPVLRELLDEKVYVGMSAGSMIFSRLHAAAVDALDDHDEVEMLQLEEVGPALPLFDWFFVAHLGAPYFPHSPMSGRGRPPSGWEDRCGSSPMPARWSSASPKPIPRSCRAGTGSGSTRRASSSARAETRQRRAAPGIRPECNPPSCGAT